MKLMDKAGKRFTILAVAEGAISKEDAELPKKKYKEKLEARAKKYPSVSYEIADQIYKEIGSEVRVTYKYPSVKKKLYSIAHSPIYGTL